jgi:hypothetical protein
MTPPDRTRWTFWRERIKDAGYIVLAGIFTVASAFVAFNIRKYPTLHHEPIPAWKLPLYELLLLSMAGVFGYLLYRAVKKFIDNLSGDESGGG